MILVVAGSLPYESYRELGLLEAYARQHLVIYIDPDLRFSFGRGGRMHTAASSTAAADYPETGILRLPVAAPLPGNRFAVVAQVNRWLAVRRLLRGLNRHTRRDIVLVLQYPRLFPTLRGLPAALKIYELVDDYVALMTNARDAHAMARAHERTVRESDLVVTTSSTLYQQVLAMEADAVESSNGVEYAAFSDREPPRTPGTLESIPRPRIGLVGNLNDRIDWELIEKLCDERQDWHFVFVGPVYGGDDGTTSALPRLSARQNFHLLAPVTRDALATTIGGFDVCLIPYRLTAATRGINPLKLYQYLAAGKPVVASPLPQLGRFADVVTACGTPAAFSSGIAEALRTVDDCRMSRARQDRAREFDWATIADARLSAIRKRLCA